ncbi:TPA: hypothetical protein ACOEQ0_002592 [Stenotrophomonas maltophilia]|nr:hypothetical protein [Stenotrophomonas maltophilia]
MSKMDFTPLFRAGFHNLDWQKLVELCVDPFPTSTRRPKLCAQLNDFISELRAMGLLGKLWIDGSFVTEKMEPGDVDVVFVPDPLCKNEFTANLSRIDALFHRQEAKAKYNCHAFIVNPNSADSLAYWRGLFGFCHDTVTPKGLVVLSL